MDRIDIEVLLFQAGYLTIGEILTTPFDTIEYSLKLPNKEVRLSFGEHLVRLFNPEAPNSRLRTDLYRALLAGDVGQFETALRSLFASLPYHHHTRNGLARYEGYYASVLYAYFQALGIEIRGEDVTNKGRIDLTLFVGEKIYILEFKVGATGEEALRQIEERGYAQKYLPKAEALYLVGIGFDETERNVGSVACRKL